MNSSSGAESAAREAARPDGPSEMEERVARALARRLLLETLRSGSVAGEDSPAALAVAAVGAEDELWPSLIEDARAAISAMREPTEGMLDAGAKAARGMTFSDYPRKTDAALYRAMIDAALSPTSGEKG